MPDGMTLVGSGRCYQGNGATGASSSGSSATTAALAALLEGGVGPLTSEGLFLLMCEMVEAQKLQLSAKVKAFKENTALQNQYNEFNEWMQAAQSAATAEGGASLTEADVLKMLDGMGFTGDERARMAAAILETDTGGKRGLIEPNELAAWVNERVFGAENTQLHVQLEVPKFKDSDADEDYTGGTFLSSHFEQITQKVESKQKANCGDTSLLTTEISQLVSEQERLTNMFTNILKKFHDTDMAVIRNI